jgi:hypothetical protein
MRESLCAPRAVAAALTIACGLGAGTLPARAADGSPSPRVVGWTEEAWVLSSDRSDAAGRVRLMAKLDTGADTSSIDARHWRVVSRGGSDWVELVLGGEDREATAVKLAGRLVRWATIKRAGAPSERRPVVQLPICVAGVSGDAEVTVADRRGLDYRLLVGRSFLAGRLAVDPARRGSADGACARQ